MLLVSPSNSKLRSTEPVTVAVASERERQIAEQRRLEENLRQRELKSQRCAIAAEARMFQENCRQRELEGELLRVLELYTRDQPEAAEEHECEERRRVVWTRRKLIHVHTKSTSSTYS